MSRRIAVMVPPQGDLSDLDHADTFRQAREVCLCVEELGNQSVTTTFGEDRDETARELRRAAPDLVFNLVEDVAEGPDHLHLATALLDRLRLPHTGAPTAALAALGDKRGVQAQLAAAGLPVPASLADGPPDARYIVKSAVEHASIGLDASSVVAGRAAAQAAMAERHAQRGGSWYAEAYVDGREFSIGLVETRAGVTVLPASEILFLDHAERPKIIGYEEKWEGDSPAYHATPSHEPDEAVDGPLLAELGGLSRDAWALFGLRGYARIDFRVDPDGRPFIVDVNANPCLAREAGFCHSALRMGMTQTDLIAHLIEAALA